MRLRPRPVLYLAVAIVLTTANTAIAVPYEPSTLDPVSPTAGSPFAPCPEAATPGGTVYVSGEVEPHVAANPDDPTFLVGGWQQDRWSNGGANGNSSAVSTDGGVSWSVVSQTQHSICAGGTPANGGDYERSSDPWVAVSPDGTTYFQSLAFNNNRDLANAVLVSRLEDDNTWSDPVTLIRDTDPNVFNDKNSMTADYNDSDLAYAVWDRLVFPTERAGGRSYERALAFKGPAYFTRTTDGGETWEEARPIYDPGRNNQTIGNQIAVLPREQGDTDSTLVNAFDLIFNFKNKGKNRGLNVAVVRSEDTGETWSDAIIVDKLLTATVTTPETDEPVRTGDIIPQITVDRTDGTLYIVWQDARETGYDQIVMSASADGGLTWTTPQRVSQTPPADEEEPDGNQQAFIPQVYVLDDGTVGVLYYDFRNNDAGDDVLETDAFLVHCDDPAVDADDLCGGTWQEVRVTPESFDMRAAPVAGGFFLGDYIGLSGTDTDDDGAADAFVGFFTQSNDAEDPGTVYSSIIGPQP